MGYECSYKVVTQPENLHAIKTLTDITAGSVDWNVDTDTCSAMSSEDRSWYDQEEDLKRVSEAHPDTTIRVEWHGPEHNSGMVFVATDRYANVEEKTYYPEPEWWKDSLDEAVRVSDEQHERALRMQRERDKETLLELLDRYSDDDEFQYLIKPES